MLGFDFGMRRGVGFVGFGVEVGFVLVVFVVEFVLFDVDHCVFGFDHLFRFVTLVNIFIESGLAGSWAVRWRTLPGALRSLRIIRLTGSVRR